MDAKETQYRIQFLSFYKTEILSGTDLFEEKEEKLNFPSTSEMACYSIMV